MPTDPLFDIIPDLREITDHSQVVELCSFQMDHSGCVVAMEMAAFSLMVQ
jgi:hypothetical protein